MSPPKPSRPSTNSRPGEAEARGGGPYCQPVDGRGVHAQDFAGRRQRQAVGGERVILRILIVEDEMLVAMYIEDALMDLGHQPVGPARPPREERKRKDRAETWHCRCACRVAPLNSSPRMSKPRLLLGMPPLAPSWSDSARSGT